MAQLKSGDPTRFWKQGYQIQTIKGVVLTDAEKMAAIQSIISAAIRGQSSLADSNLLPTIMMGVTIDWSVGTMDDTVYKLTLGDLSVVQNADDPTAPISISTIRLFSMEGNTLEVDLSANNVYSSSVPDANEIVGPTQINRGALTTYTVSGSGGNINPNSLVLEYTMENGQWIGAQIPIPLSHTDLSIKRRVTIRLKGLDLTGSANFYLQIGSLSEDLDGSGLLNHDWNENGILDLEDPFHVVTKEPISTTSLTSSWMNFSFTLLNSDRGKLTATRGIRLVIVSSGATIGKILIDSLTFETSPFQVETTDPAIENIRVAEISEWSAATPPAGGDLTSRFQTTYQHFHPNGIHNQVLEVFWSDFLNSFSIQRNVPSNTENIQFHTLVSYMRSSIVGTPCAFSLLDASSHGVVWSAAIPGDNAWHEMRVSSDSITIDGVSVGTPSQFDSSYGTGAKFKIDITSSSGTLYVDEIYLDNLISPISVNYQNDVVVPSLFEPSIFFLPDTGIDTDTLKVFINCPIAQSEYEAFDGQGYRLLSSQETTLDEANGLIRINNLSERLLVFYTKDGSPVGTMGIGASGIPSLLNGERNIGAPIVFSWAMSYGYPLQATMGVLREVALPGVGNCLLLWQPGESPDNPYFNCPFGLDSINQQFLTNQGRSLSI
jgi:hypothetical protein